MCDIYNSICTESETGLRINLHLDYEDDDVTVTSKRSARGEVAVVVSEPGSVAVRVPGWAPESSLKLAVDGAAVPIKRMGHYTWVSGNQLKPNSEIVLSYELPEKVTEEEMPSGRVYTIQWRGDEIVGIDPQDEPMPFFPILEKS
jgi:hypothetical protein